MPGEKNKTLRLVVPLVLIGFGIGVASMFIAGPRKAAPPIPPTNQQANQTANETQPPAQSEDQPADTQAPPTSSSATDLAAPGQALEAETAAEQTPAPNLGVLRARIVERTDTAPIGDLNYQSGAQMRIEFTPLGAGIDSITLSDHFDNTYLAHDARTGNPPSEGHYTIQERARTGAEDQSAFSISSLATRAAIINGATVDLYSRDRQPVWRETAPGAFVCEVENEAGDLIATINKSYSLADGSYDIRVDQTLTNHTDQPLSVEWIQYGPVDLPPDYSGYQIDTRRVRFGYLRPISNDPTQQLVVADSKLYDRNKAIKSARKTNGLAILYPNADRYKNAADPVWAAQTNRYFAFVIHPLLDTSAPTPDKSFQLASREVDAILLDEPGAASRGMGMGEPGRMVLQLRSAPLAVAPNSNLDVSFGAYAGPMGKKALNGITSSGVDPAKDLYQSLNLPGMVSYVMGMCAFCTFQPLARALLAGLTLAHDYLFHDWALSIMLLVVVVRTILHPITKKSQISLQRFSKQMQALAPKQQKIREKYKDDPKRMQQEMMTLMKSEGVNYAGALGCLPMFLQTPIWIALYAMLYFAFELRHEPAFYGVFQNLSNGSWHFLSDLSTADHFIDFGHTVVTIPLIGAVSGINVLPLLLGVVFFLQQKYLTPPPSASMTPEQQSQQKIMKVMMVVMFPVMMYNAPSGLTIYFITNSTLGILESRYIRSHVNQLDLEPNKKPAPTGRKKVQNTASPFGKKNRSEGGPKYKKRK